MNPYFQSEDKRVSLYLGDCRESLKALPDNSVDAIVTDPPAGVSFMNKAWDSDKGGRDKWIAWLEGIAVECKRVLKPGGHAFVWALPRTSHWTGMAWENAGFEPRDKISHLFGSGFPKSMSISKQLGKSDLAKMLTLYSIIDLVKESDLVDLWKRSAAAEKPFRHQVVQQGHESFARVLVAQMPNLERKYLDAVIAELNTSEALHTVAEKECCSAPASAVRSSTESKPCVKLARSPLSGENHNYTIIFSALGRALVSQGENMVAKLKAAEALKTWLGRKRSTESADTSALCAALESDLKLIISSQSKTFLVSDTTQQTAFVSAMTVTITESMAESLISFTVDTLKSQVSQKIDRLKPVGEKPPSLGMATGPNADQWNQLNKQLVMPEPEGEAKDWEGFGTALKPAQENWWLFRKPLEGTIVDNVKEYGTGALNIDGCRVDTLARKPGGKITSKRSGMAVEPDAGRGVERKEFISNDEWDNSKGRWPPNLLISHDDRCVLVGKRDARSGTAVQRNGGGRKIFGGMDPDRSSGGATPDQGYGDGSKETVDCWACVPGCPVRAIDEQSGYSKSSMSGDIKSNANDSIGTFKTKARTTKRQPGAGGASRFFPCFYCPKPSKAEKNKGCENLPIKTPEEMTGRKEGSAGLVMKHDDGSDKANPYAGTSGEARRNPHPTVKPVKLMRWLCRLICPPGGTVLDPFNGSGTTGVAAREEGFKYVGMDLSEEYLEITKARIGAVEPEPEEELIKPVPKDEDETPSLFGDNWK